MSQIRKRKILPVHVVEQHNDVLPFIHRAIASRILPFSGIPMIHFDSHPDLLLPPTLEGDTVFQPQKLYESLSIENWLLPLAYAKHVSHIVWVKPPWAKQIEKPEHNFLIGKCANSGKIRVSCKEDYFLTDGLFRSTKDLMETTDVRLQVLEVLPPKWADLDPSYTAPVSMETVLKPGADSLPSAFETWTGLLQDNLKDLPYILDVDLDFFSTANPFKEMLKAHEEEAIRRLYSYTPVNNFTDESVQSFTSAREKQLAKLENLFTALNARWSNNKELLPSIECESLSLVDIKELAPEEFMAFDHQEQLDLATLCLCVIQEGDQRDITFTQLHDYGCTLDSTELPHHISTQAQVDALFAAFSTVLEKLPKPTIVTIARSSEDDYCPRDSVDMFERKVLKLLEQFYGSLEITRDCG